MEWILTDAAYRGDEKEARKILEGNRNISVNWKDPNGWTALHCAICNGKDKIVSLLLVHPDIDVNSKNNCESTPFLFACEYGMISCARLLLNDTRVGVNESNNGGYTPLWYTARYGRLELIKWWIVSGREMHLETARNFNTAIGVAKKWGKTDVVSLLEKFETNPTQTRHEVRIELGCFDELAAELFAVVIFLCDGILKIKEEKTDEATRFFEIAKRLPMELQMMLCYRVVGSMKINILGEQRELAFKKLAKRLVELK
jgi:hypothetical protein